MKLEETEEYQEMVENAKRDILAQMTMREVMKDAVVTEEDVKNYYEEHKQQFTKGETVRAKHILTDSKEKCDAILAAIQSGETSFEDAAKEKSTCPSGAKGGDLGEFGKGQMVKEFEDAAFTAEIGAIVIGSDTVRISSDQSGREKGCGSCRFRGSKEFNQEPALAADTE